MPIELRLKRDHVCSYIDAIQEGLPLQPPDGGWTVQDLVTISAMARRIAMQWTYEEASADCDSNEQQEFYLLRADKEIEGALEAASGTVGDWVRHSYPDKSDFRIACEDVDQPAKVEFLND